MNKKLIAILTAFFLLGGCVTGFTLVEPGTATIGNLSVDSGTGYNRAPALSTQRKGSEAWTKDGMLLDRLVFIPAVPDGEPLLKPIQKDVALPVFRKDMLPNELEELVESTLVKEFGEGNAALSTSNLRPHRFGEHRGVMFNVSATVSESPEYKGTVGAFIVEEHLYIMWYFAADPYYFDKHQSQAESIIQSARLVSVTES